MLKKSSARGILSALLSGLVAVQGSHYTSIGMPNINNYETTVECAKRVLEDPDTIVVPVNGGNYYRWFSPCGSELWGEVVTDGDGTNRFDGFEPHFHGISRTRIGIMSKMEGHTDMNGFFECRNNPESDFLDMFNFEFSCPDYRSVCDNLVLPCTASVQIAAFAEEIHTFDTLEEYEKYSDDQGKDTVAFASQSFASASVFSEERDKKCHAIITGHVIQTEMKTNELTGEHYYWAMIESVGGSQFDVVIDLRDLSFQKAPKPGGVIHGYFWLSGRIVPGSMPSMSLESWSGEVPE